MSKKESAAQATLDLLPPEDETPASLQGKRAALLKCHKVRLEEVNLLSLEELFSGYDTLQAITFSYDIDFIEQLIRKFRQGQILIGGNFLVMKDTKANEYLANLASASESADKELKAAIEKYPEMSQRIQDGTLFFRTPMYIIDHRKTYLLSSADGRTRVIRASANMTRRAWNGSHAESYVYDDSRYAYEECLENFQSAWKGAQSIPIPVKKEKNASGMKEQENPVMQKVKEVGKLTVIQPDETELLNAVRYKINLDACQEKNKEIFKGVAQKRRDRMITLEPKSLSIIKSNMKSWFQKMAGAEEKTKDYPQLTFDYAEHAAYLDGERLDLAPDAADVKRDIEEIQGLFSNFDLFLGDTQKLKETHFKLLNFLFASPFHAQLRCTALLKGIGTTSLPMFALISSKTANNGKTFMIRAILKMMTGLSLVSQERPMAGDFARIQGCCKGVPIFVDEIDNKYVTSTLEAACKNDEECENRQRSEQPVIIYASNRVTDPQEFLRKRMVFFRLDCALPSDIDQDAFKNKGNALIRRLSHALYRAYLGKMLNRVNTLLNFMWTENDISDEWYPDLMRESSLALLELWRENGFAIPSYMRTLSWKKDYSIHADCISSDCIHEIVDFYHREKSAFTVRGNLVIIEMGTDPGSLRTAKNWLSSLPNEMTQTKEPIKTRDCVKVVLYKTPLESRTGIRFGKWYRFF